MRFNSYHIDSTIALFDFVLSIFIILLVIRNVSNFPSADQIQYPSVVPTQPLLSNPTSLPNRSMRFHQSSQKTVPHSNPNKFITIPQLIIQNYFYPSKNKKKQPPLRFTPLPLSSLYFSFATAAAISVRCPVFALCTGLRSGEITPNSLNTSRPGSAMSSSTTASGVVYRRSLPASAGSQRKPRPISIAVTGVSGLAKEGLLF